MTFVLVSIAFANENGSTNVDQAVAKVAPQIQKLVTEFQAGEKDKYCQTGLEVLTELSKSFPRSEDGQEKSTAEAAAVLNQYIQSVGNYGLTESAIEKVSADCGFLEEN